MTNEAKPKRSRLKFLLLGVSAVTLFPISRWFALNRKPKQKTIKMLTQDGRLVEINEADLPAKRKKIQNQELQNWVSTNKPD